MDNSILIWVDKMAFRENLASVMRYFWSKTRVAW